MATIAEALNQAFQYHQAGALPQAEQLYRQVLQADPNNADAHHLLGVLAYQQGRLDVAVASMRQAVALNPGAPAVHSNLGLAQEALGQVAEAVASYRSALRLVPNFPEAHNNLGKALRQQGHIDLAMTHYREALRLRPAYTEALNNLGNALLDQANFDEAANCFRRALCQSPNYATAWNNLGNVQMAQAKLGEAVSSYRQAIQLQPNFTQAWYNLGNALRRQDQLDEAGSCYLQALQLDPNHPHAHNNLGNIRNEQARFEEALASFDQAVRLDPGRSETHVNRGLLLLRLGRWPEGWPEFEWRWQSEDFSRNALPNPRWDGTDLGGRTILLDAEQGLGDTIQFIRYAALAKKRDGKVIIRCQPGLMPLLSSFRDMDELVSRAAPLPQCDVQAPLVSLPAITQTTVETVPSAVPYLHADPNLADHWRRELEPLAGFKVGIAWQGSKTFFYDRQRSIPLCHFARLAAVEGVRLISLQKGPGTEQIADLAGKFEVLDWSARLDEANGAFMDTAAVMKNLDLVISSDTTIVHLAGALAVPVWVALPTVPDWRWLLHREDSPWYPGMRLFRQRRSGDWDEVFERIAGELKMAKKSSAKKW